MNEADVRKTHDLDVRHDATGQRLETVVRCERDSAPIETDAIRRCDSLKQKHLIGPAAKLPAFVNLFAEQAKLSLAEQSLKEAELDLLRAENERQKVSGKASGEAVATLAVKHASNKQAIKARVANLRSGISLIHADVQHATTLAREALKEHLVAAFTAAKADLHEQAAAAKKRLQEMESTFDELAAINRADTLAGYRTWGCQVDVETIVHAVRNDGE